MKKTWIVLACLAAVIILVGSAYNTIISKSEAVKNAWAQVENVYQRRADLIPNLVATVKGYAAHEQNTLEGVMEARAKASQTVIDPTQMTPESLQQFQAAQSEVSNALGRLMVVVERYPDLKANQNFLELQAQLEGTENRIATERKRFNEATQAYNTYILRFPNNLLANLFGFEQKPYFTADEGANQVPKVQF